MTIEIGPLYGYRLWMVKRGKVTSICASPHHCYIGFRVWPTEPTSAVCSFSGAPARMKEDGWDGYAAAKSRPWRGEGADEGLFFVTTHDGSYFGDMTGRVEMWGTVIEGPRGYRAEYMAPTHLVEPIKRSFYAAEYWQQISDNFLAFAAAWGATICTLEELP